MVDRNDRYVIRPKVYARAFRVACVECGPNGAAVGALEDAASQSSSVHYLRVGWIYRKSLNGPGLRARGGPRFASNLGDAWDCRQFECEQECRCEAADQQTT